MNTVTLGLPSAEATTQRMAAAFRGEVQGAHLSFASAELLWKVLTAKRWEILRAMTGEGEIAIREIARRVGRDVKAVHGDVQALLTAGILDRADRGVIFPYDAIHVDFTLTKAA
ncbi:MULTISPECIES: transcriptional regulator [Hyphomicrobiales]|jgi:predicted transcriptional regulator|uniref:Transcriptional regulator n=1 Tax=Bosea massiliensis TaxID=151419 RepID=A0ABW0P2Q3_9HYPH|nr:MULTISPECIES: transcriptional regulator [Hyphomicrobiales]PZR81760.1 MAG: transcriptional regulator [Stutzerimonas stutzeri]